MKLHLLIIFLCLSSIVSFAQHNTAEDSLLHVLNITTTDTTKINTLVALSGTYIKTKPELALKYAEEGIALAVAKKWGSKNAELYFNLGYACNSLGKNDSAVLVLQQCIDFSKKNNNPSLQVKSFVLISSMYTNQAKYKEAAEAAFKALDIAEASREADLAATAYSNLSVLFYNQSNFDKAITYGEKSLKILKKEGDAKTLGPSYLNLGLVYADINNVLKAEEYYKNALQLFAKIDAKLYMATTYGNLSLITVNINLKLDYLLKAQKIWDEVAPDYPNAAGNIGNLGSAYYAATLDSNFVQLKSGEGIIKDKTYLLHKAETLLKIACEKCRKLKFDRDLHFFTGELAKVEEARGNYKIANSYLREYIQLNDSIYSQENKNKIAAVEGDREVAIRDKQIELNKLSLSAQRKIRGALIAGLFLLAVIGGMFYWQSRTRRRTNTTLVTLNNELDEANKVKARFFGIISHDLRSPVANLVTFLNMQRDNPEIFSKEKEAEHRAAIGASAESLLETMEAMLQWSKSQMENFKPQLKKTNVEDLFTYIQANFPGDKTYTIRFSNPANLSLVTDEDYLKTILHNLTANAIKALQQTPNAHIAWNAFEENGKTVLSVTDNGPGANEQQIEALYNKEAAVNSKNGLGLHIIRDLARAIHCAISFSSKAGMGTTFQLTLN